MQDMMNHWEGELWTTRGALSAKKSYWCAIDFQWDKKKSKWTHRDKKTVRQNLHIKDNLCNVEKLELLKRTFRHLSHFCGDLLPVSPVLTQGGKRRPKAAAPKIYLIRLPENFVPLCPPLTAENFIPPLNFRP